MHVICISISKSFAAICSPSRPGPRFPPRVLFYLFPPVGASQAREFQIATTTTPRKTVQTTFCTGIYFSTKSSKSRVFWSVFACFCNVFLQNTVSYTFAAIKPFQNIIFYNVSNSLVSSNAWNHRYLHLFTLFSSIFPCSNVAGQLKHKKILQKHFLQFFTMFSVKNTVIYTFFGPKHWFLQCFQCSGIRKPFKISLFTMFFHFCPFFHCRKPTKMTQNYVSIPS